jgi:NADH-quinone oxidoreductase subunit C
MLRAKAKAMIVKVGKGTAERPPMPEVAAPVTVATTEESSAIEVNNDINKKVREMIEEKFPGSTDEGKKFIQLKPQKWFEIASWLKIEDSLFFDSLQCQTGFDLGDDILEARYNLHSMKHDHYAEIRIQVPKNNPKISSVEKVWRIADWFERETYDMLGIEFEGHRDMRRILLPDDWEGWPLRKDYETQDTYHGIVIPKMKEGWE